MTNSSILETSHDTRHRRPRPTWSRKKHPLKPRSEPPRPMVAVFAKAGAGLGWHICLMSLDHWRGCPMAWLRAGAFVWSSQVVLETAGPTANNEQHLNSMQGLCLSVWAGERHISSMRRLGRRLGMGRRRRRLLLLPGASECMSDLRASEPFHQGNRALVASKAPSAASERVVGRMGVRWWRGMHARVGAALRVSSVPRAKSPSGVALGRVR